MPDSISVAIAKNTNNTFMLRIEKNDAVAEAIITPEQFANALTSIPVQLQSGGELLISKGIGKLNNHRMTLNNAFFIKIERDNNVLEIFMNAEQFAKAITGEHVSFERPTIKESDDIFVSLNPDYAHN